MQNKIKKATCSCCIIFVGPQTAQVRGNVIIFALFIAASSNSHTKGRGGCWYLCVTDQTAPVGYW